MNHRFNVGLPVLIIGIALCGLGLWLLLSPTYYKAVVTIKIESDTVFAPPVPRYSVPYDPYFMETELKRIESESVLSNVVEALNLDVEWGKRHGNGQRLDYGETIELLRRYMVLDAERNTRLVDISFIDQDPDEAARIANAIADAYINYRAVQYNQEMAGGLKILEDRYDKEETDIKSKWAELEQLMKQSNVTKSRPTDAYNKARLNLAEEEGLHELLRAKIQADKIDFSKGARLIPPSTVVKPAVAPKDPIAPNRLFGTLLLVCGLVASFWGFHSLFIRGRVAGNKP